MTYLPNLSSVRQLLTSVYDHSRSLHCRWGHQSKANGSASTSRPVNLSRSDVQKSMARTNQQRAISFRELPFSELIKRDQQLADLRREYAQCTVEERRVAAEWAYDESIATHLFNQGLVLAGQKSSFQESWPEGIAALAIDPTYAPAMLTVGSMEYQLGRREEAAALFYGLLKLPTDTPELEVIIDKAGDYLLSEKDYDRAAGLYTAAAALFPASTAIPGGLGYCLGKLKRMDESVAVHRRALALDPNNYVLLNDLGWALTESGQFAEAEALLEKAMDLAPPGDDLARNNLENARRRKRLAYPTDQA
jgi:tetratricopeptide (TPR) repeat protein